MTSVWHPGDTPGQDEPRGPSTGEHVEHLLTTGLDRYELRRLLGVGGMGEVYLGVHRTIEKEVAIKVLSYEHRDNAQLNQRFLDEAKAASKIRHENIVDITDFGHSPQGCAYFVMEYLMGEDLMTTLQNEGRLPWARACHLVVQLLEALDAAHAHGIVHRDVKPANCMRITRGRDHDALKVLDFGIARISEGRDQDRDSRLTQAGTIMGTAEYMAPEQARGEDVDARTDLYAAGVMLFELCTGRLPFTAKTSVEVLSKHIYEEPPKPSDVLHEVDPEAELPDALEALILRALAKDPEDRFETALDMLDAIEALEPERFIGYSGLSHPGLSTPSGITVGPTAITGRANTMPGAAEPDPESESESESEAEPTPRKRLPWALVGLGGIAVTGVSAWLTLGPQAAPCPDDMVLIEGGAFFMGTDDEETYILQQSRPTHKVELGAYCMDIHEVTVDKFHECSNQGQCRRPYKDSRWPNAKEHAREALSQQCNENDDHRGTHPINCVTWEQARDYCAFVGKRLPEESEWEFAARGSDGRVFPWGDAEPTPDHANLCDAECETWREQQGLEPGGNLGWNNDGWSGTAPVGSFPAGMTQHGLHDVVGNVFEWTATEFALYEGHPEDVDERSGYVIRGGSHNSGYTFFSDPALRYAQDPTAHTHAIGFRCAADPNEG